VLGVVGVVMWILLFAAWIGVAFLRNSADRNAGAVALNLVVVALLAVAGLIATHRGMYRWFWHLDRKRAAGTLRLGEPEPRYGSEPTEPLPRIDWPLSLRLRHALITLLGIATLFYAFAPYENQRAIVHFIWAHSAGRGSAGSLSSILFGYLPMAGTAALAMLLTWRQMKRRDAGLLDERATMMLEAETNWLFSFGAAFTVTALLCRMAGSMIVAYL
jgi:hypothetical protein